MSKKFADHTLIVTELNHLDSTSSILDAVAYDTAPQRDVAMQLIPEVQPDLCVNYELTSFDEEFSIISTKLISREDAEHLFGRSINEMRPDGIVLSGSEHFSVAAA